MKKLETASYKGVRDFYPEDMFVLDYIMSVWHNVLQNYGYEYYSASILEPTELYESKTSEEIISEQTYNFIDRGDRRVTLRPEMTPTVTRMVAKRFRELSLPLKWYSIPNVFRYERPQKGRLREHFQLNVDVFGLSGNNAEAELIEIAHKIMTKFGLAEKDFIIKVSDRIILEKVLSDLNLNEEKKSEFKKLLDKRNKITDFNEQSLKILGKPFDLKVEPNSEINDLIQKLNQRGITNVVFDPSLVRGFDYYTGIVFEIFDTNPENKRSVFGGGRYDNLIENFGIKKIPTVGFGMGDVTTRDVLELRNLIPQIKSPADLGVSILDDSSVEYSIGLANQFRNSGFKTLIHYPNKKVGDQIKYFDKKKIPFVVFVGPDEVSSKQIKIKNLKTAEEKSDSFDGMVEYLKNNL